MKRYKTSERTQEKNKSGKFKMGVGYVLGSVATFAAACVTLPAIMAKTTGILYKAILKSGKK